MNVLTGIRSRSSFVSVEEFTTCMKFYGFFKPAKASNVSSANPSPFTVGVCVSGGPDSMALIHLLHMMRHPQKPSIPAFTPHAFIVDHGLRSESSHEAKYVQDSLQSAGITCKILKIKWPSSSTSPKLRGVEKIARVGRYQTIFEAANRLDIRHLFTGHHHDDQMETLLLRFIRDQTLNPFALQGMQQSSTIPCCDRFLGARPRSTWESHSSKSQNQALKLEETWVNGTQLHRPLLSFSKSQLIATCSYYNIPYVQDKTNLDVTYTTRNAVRQLRSNRLPKALQDSRLLELQTKASSLMLSLEEESALRFQKQFRIRKYTPGVMLEMTIVPTNNGLDTRSIAYGIPRLLELISPQHPDQIPTMLDLETSVEFVHKIQEAAATKSFTHRMTLHQTLAEFTQGDWQGKCHLRLSRQPMNRSEVVNNCQDIIVSGSESAQDKVSIINLNLWDNRFWIQTIAPNKEQASKIQIRSYGQHDVADIKDSLAWRNDWHLFHQTLGELAPGSSRYTLPILTYCKRVIAFPSLNLKIRHVPGVEYKVDYPRSCRALDFLHNIQPGISRMRTNDDPFSQNVPEYLQKLPPPFALQKASARPARLGD